MIGDVHDRMIDFHTKWSETINRDQSARNRAVINYGNTNILYGILKQKDTVKWYYHARIGQLLQNLELESRIFVLRPADMKVCLSQKDFVHSVPISFRTSSIHFLNAVLARDSFLLVCWCVLLIFHQIF